MNVFSGLFSQLQRVSKHLFNVMKKIVFLIIILVFTGLIFAQTPQEKPLTQTEYVKLLNDLQRNPKLRDEIVESVRRRGVSFPVTDGLVGLTRTKSSSDAELIRTVERSWATQG